jgi:uncharacterized membrane protein YbhN (UPF0104 family)
VASALKWRLLLRASGLEVGVGEALRAHAAGLFANLCLPSLVGGDVVRAGWIARGGRDLARPAAAGLADRAIDSLALVALAALASGVVPGAWRGGAGRPLAAAALALLGVTIGGILAARALDPERLPERAARFLRPLREALGALAARRRAAAAALAISLAVQGGFVLLNAALGAAVGIALPLAVWFLAWPLAKLAALLPVSLGGIGVREVALAALLAPFGVAPALAVGQSLAWETLLVASGLAAGAALPWLARSRAVAAGSAP